MSPENSRVCKENWSERNANSTSASAKGKKMKRKEVERVSVGLLNDVGVELE
jgi:hypothetical protein